MIRWLGGVSMKDRKTSEELRKLGGNVWSFKLKAEAEAEDRLEDQEGHG